LTGSAIDNCAVYVVNAANELVEAGEIGQVYVAGAHVADGYINRREMASFVANVVEDRKGK
jgi:non-ribosomal peptide synthetase component F